MRSTRQNHREIFVLAVEVRWKIHQRIWDLSFKDDEQKKKTRFSISSISQQYLVEMPSQFPGFPSFSACKNKDLSVIHIFTNNIQKHSVYVHLICFSLHESFMIFFNFLTVCDENTTEHSSWSSQNKSSSHQRASVTLSKNNNIYITKPFCCEVTW